MLLLVASEPLHAADVLIEHRFMDGVVLLTLHDAKVDPEALKPYLVVHPVGYDATYHIGVDLSLCVEGDPAYRPCGTRDYRAKHFLENATHNVAETKRFLGELRALKRFPELQPLVDYFVSSLSFSLWKDQTLLAYYQTWDPNVLTKDYKDLPVRQTTKSILARLISVDSIQERWEIASYEWANEANRLYREKEGDIPRRVWAEFLASHKINERVDFDEID
jgi:hypothetical protein